MPTVCLPDGYRWTCADSAECWVIHHEIFERRCYVRPDDPVPPGGLIVDVGAHVGLFALFSTMTWHPSDHIAIEAAPPSVDLLRRNVSENRLTNVTVVHAAVGDRRGVGVLTYYPRLPGNSTLHPDVKHAELAAFGPRSQRRMQAMFDEGQRYQVPMMTLTDVLRGRAPDPIQLLKVDVESAEAAVLRGISPDIWPRIARVVVEVSHYLPDGLSTISNLLTQQGMHIHVAEPGAPGVATLLWGSRRVDRGQGGRLQDTSGPK